MSVSTASSKVVVLLSGGIDSMVLAHQAREEDRLQACISFDYGHPAARHEAWYVSEWCVENRIQNRHVIMPLSDTIAMLNEPGALGPRIVPARNMAFLSFAVNYASAMSADTVWFGATRDDEKDYRDCRKDFVESLSSLSNYICRVRIEAPFLDMSKRDVVKLGRTLGVKFSKTWSCYTPVETFNEAPAYGSSGKFLRRGERRGGPPRGRHCGTCNACIQRAEALNEGT